MFKIIMTAVFMYLMSIIGANSVEFLKDGKPVEVPICGGFPGFECKKDQWCDYPANAVCGAVDQFGTCKPRPKNCPKSFIPVCGCDGQNYGNDCEAAAAGIDVAYVGYCRAAPK